MAAIPQGAIRFNTDSQKLEFYAQGEWWNMVTDTPNLGTSSDTTAGARGVFGGGTPTPSSSNNVIQYINISSTGNSIDFGDLTITRLASGTASSSTRGVWAGGSQFPARINNIDYVTISSTGDALDFGDLSSASTGLSTGVSNSTRGCFGGGDSSPVNTIQYITIASTGDAKDFGDLLGTRRGSNTCSSPTRGIFAGGVPSPSFINTIEFITLSSLGDSQDFGDLIAATDFANSNNISNSTRGVFAGGANPSYSDDIQYITISSLGNAVNFGNLSVPADAIAGCSSPTRGVFAALRTASPFTITDTIEYISIQTQGNSVDFGNLLNSTYIPGGLSNAHGGL